MESRLNNYLFKTNINSEYQLFWITHDIFKLCPSAELSIIFNTENRFSKLFIINSSLSLSQIQFVFIENQIEYKEIIDSINLKQFECKIIFTHK
ncbi:hypothetical protein [Flavobacterium columnare]|jgi:hypothetical protein|uniref:hypothetical protein n=1 Tax=Flavobacterium columnare TaxID=996 RepID=UPI0040333DEB